MALGIPVGLQALVTFFSSRSKRFERVVTSHAVMLVDNGRYLHDMPRKETITEDEVNQAIPRQGLGSIKDVAAVVLEANGEMTVIPRQKSGDGSMVANIPRSPDEP